MKFCNKCKQHKELSEFHKRLFKTYIGVKSNCKNCVNTQNSINGMKKHNRRKPARSPEALREWKNEYSRKYRKKASYKIKHAFNQAKRRAEKLKATPKWLTEKDLAHIAAYYETAAILTQEFGTQMDVDHIIPLKGKNVCGLHVPWNLQIMEHRANMIKNNKLEDDNG